MSGASWPSVEMMTVSVSATTPRAVSVETVVTVTVSVRVADPWCSAWVPPDVVTVTVSDVVEDPWTLTLAAVETVTVTETVEDPRAPSRPAVVMVSVTATVEVPFHVVDVVPAYPCAGYAHPKAFPPNIYSVAAR